MRSRLAKESSFPTVRRMIGQGSPSDCAYDRANFGSRQWRLRAWLTAISLVLSLLLTSEVRGEEVDLRLRLAWGGASQAWQGTIEVSQGTILAVDPLGLEADAPGSMQISSPTLVRVLPRIPRGYDACDLHVRVDPAATLKIRLSSGDRPARVLDIPVANIVQGLESHPLDDTGSRFLAQRSPGDALRVEFDRPSLVYTTGEKFSCRLVPNYLQLPINSTVSLQVQLTSARSDQELQGFARDIKLDSRGEAVPEALELDLPMEEGVYDVRLSLLSKRYTPSLLRAKPLLERRVQIVVLAKAEPPLVPSRAAQLESSIDPATPKWWERLTRMPTWANISSFSTGPVGDQAPAIKNRLGKNLVELLPKSWQAYPLTTTRPGEPHKLVIEYPSDVPQALGISLIEPNAAGKVVPLGVDTGILVPAPLPGHEPQMERHELIIWPQTRNPVVLLVNRSDSAPATYGEVKLVSFDSLAPLSLPNAGPDSRELTVYFDKPIFNRAFSADEALDPITKRNRDDWQTFYRGGQRLTEYLRHAGYNAAVIPAWYEGSSLYPSEILQPNPSYDNGAFFETGQDPVRKDVLEMLFRQFDRAGLRLVPSLNFTTPLPALEALRATRDSTSEGLAAIGPDGRTAPIATMGGRRGQGPYYNPLDPRVQRAIEDVVREVAMRYAHHPSFGGISLHLGPESYLLLPDATTGLDDVTWERFSKATNLVQIDEPQRHAARAAQLQGETRQAWIEWRANEISDFMLRLRDIVRQRNPRAELVLAGGDMLTDRNIQESLRPTLPTSKIAPNLFLPAGLDLAAVGVEGGVNMPRPQRISPLTVPTLTPLLLHWNQSPQVDQLFASRSTFIFHEPSPLHLPAFDEKSPFGKENTHTWFVPALAPAGYEARRRFVHDLAARDPQEIIDGSWMPVFGQEEAVRPFVEVFRQLPRGEFQTHSPPANQLPTTPVVVRSLLSNGNTWVYAVNDSPWEMKLQLEVAASPGLNWESLGALTPATTVEPVAGGLRITTTLAPYGVIGGKIAGVANVRGWQANPPADLQSWLRDRVRETRLRANALRSPEPVASLPNAGFEQPAQPGNVPGWVFPRGADISVEVSQQHRQEGNSSLRLRNQRGPGGQAQVLWVRSDPIPAPRTGRLSLLVWLRIDDPAQQPTLRLAVEARVDGKPYYRRANVGAVEDNSPARPLQTGWMPYRFPINDLPLTGLSDLRVGFDLMSAGEVWIDRVEVYDLWLEDHERDELLKNIASAELQLDAQKLLECERFLESPWPTIVRDLVPLKDGQLMVGNKENNRPARDDSAQNAISNMNMNPTAPTNGKPAANAESDADRTGFMNKWRDSLPKWPWR